MKFTKLRVLSATLAMSILMTACGGTTEAQNTEVETEIEQVTIDDVTIEKEEVDVVGAAAETEPELSAEEQEWLNYMMPNVEESLNVRAEANEEAELAGKLSKGDLATVIQSEAEWTKIQSGNLVGYVKNEYCIFGLEALAYAKENVDTVATVTTDILYLREAMSTDSKVIESLARDRKLVVDTAAVTEEGWVAVKYNDNTYYVSAEYVTVGLDLGTGLTVAEIAEIERKEAEAKAAAEKKAAEEKAAAAAKAAAAQSSSSASTANVDDLTLLAAIIYCEAGCEPYEAQVAVGSVIMNRVRSGRYPNTISGVVYQKGQFTPARSGKLATAISQGKATSSCYQAAQAVLNGTDNTNGCLYFNDYYGTQEGLRFGGMVFWW